MQTDTPMLAPASQTKPAPIAPLLVTEREAAGLLKVSPATIFRLRRDGHLKSVKILGSVRIAVDDLRAFIESRKVAC